MINKSFNTSFWGCLPKLPPLTKRARGPFGPFWEQQTLHFSPSKDQCGFTLVEMMIALALGIFVISGVTDVFISQQRAYNIQDQVSEMQQNVRVAMERITRSIRSAGYDPRKNYIFGITNNTWANSNSSGLAITTAQEIYLTIDNDSDGVIDDSTSEKIGYKLESNTLKIFNLGTDWKNLAENIETLTFTYIFSDGGTGNPSNSDADTTNDTSDIRRIRVSLTAKTSKKDPDLKSGDGYRRRTLTASVKPRNLGLE